ncbi:MAG: DUF2752 domain-containing protein [Proteobacteria bacterium]|nr:DUF2752 domain-containing protein [Pseudomonadota bacterium]MCP4921602.1 DUF2752 domain-containing protein [Pseudomonadota bacterium]
MSEGAALGFFSRLSSATRDRLVALTLGLPSWAVLGVAAWLDADPAGHGTHKQLGLGTCTILAMTGWPCPMCGMTTTFTHMAHGSVLDAVVTQPFGVVLFLLTLATGLIALADLAMPRGRFTRAWSRLLRHETWVAAALLAGLTLGWIYKLWEMQAGPFA